MSYFNFLKFLFASRTRSYSRCPKIRLLSAILRQIRVRQAIAITETHEANDYFLRTLHVRERCGALFFKPSSLSRCSGYMHAPRAKLTVARSLSSHCLWNTGAKPQCTTGVSQQRPYTYISGQRLSSGFPQTTRPKTSSLRKRNFMDSPGSLYLFRGTSGARGASFPFSRSANLCF